MLGRKVIFYRPEEFHRRDFAGAKPGIFHRYGEWEGKTVIFVEDTTRSVVMVHPEGVRFTQSFEDYAAKKTGVFKSRKAHSESGKQGLHDKNAVHVVSSSKG